MEKLKWNSYGKMIRRMGIHGLRQLKECYDALVDEQSKDGYILCKGYIR